MRKYILFSGSETNKLLAARLSYVRLLCVRFSGIKTGRFPAIKKQQACRKKSGTNLVYKSAVLSVCSVKSALCLDSFYLPKVTNFTPYYVLGAKKPILSCVYKLYQCITQTFEFHHNTGINAHHFQIGKNVPTFKIEGSLNLAVS